MDSRPANRFHQIAADTPAARLALLGLTAFILAGCNREAADISESTSAAVSTSAPSANCLATGEFSGRIVGSLEGQLDWRGSRLSCTGMRRPDGEGARLRFSGPIALPGGARELAVIIALPELKRGETAKETPAKVTMIEEDTGRFFSSGNVEICWSDIERQAPLSGNSYDIRGIVYCVSPLAELRGTGDVTFTELFFSGRLDWSAP